MRDRLPELRERGAELVVVGCGDARFAAAFREDMRLDVPLLVDPELRAYRAAGLRRGRVELLSPRMPLHALRALRSGERQRGVQGDPWQLGGVFVLERGGALLYRHASREAGDHAPFEEILAALDGTAPPPHEPARAPRAQAALGRALSLVVDPLVVPSFDRTGFAIHALAFDPGDLDVDLAGRRCLVTGANAGLGYATALALADLGAEVVMLCRDAARAEDAAERIRAATGSARVATCLVDVSDLASVRAAAARLAEAPVDVLVHNAGVLPDARTETRDGLELTFATHVAGPHLLTRLLRPRLEAAEDARVVFVTSGGMYTRRLELDDAQWTRRAYDGVVAYAETKRAQVVLAGLWAQELRPYGVAVSAVHPGWADTPGVTTSLPRFHRLARSILRTPDEGADTIVWLAASERAREASGELWFDRAPRRRHVLPFTRESAADRRALWERCERIARDAEREAT